MSTYTPVRKHMHAQAVARAPMRCSCASSHSHMYILMLLCVHACAHTRMSAHVCLSGLLENSGITISPIPHHKKLFLLTSSSAPFCVHHLLLELKVSPLSRSAEVEVTLKVMGYPNIQQKLSLQTKKTEFQRVMSAPVPVCKIGSIQLKSTGSFFYRQGDVRVQSVCISEFPNTSQREALCVNDFQLRRNSEWVHDFVELCGVF